MKFAFALSLFAGVASAANPFVAKTRNTAKASYVSKLVSGARRLDEDQEEFEVDISGFSLKFEKCQFIKAYDDEVAENEEYDTVLATKHFVVFKLCPGDTCSSCSYGYGEYMIDLETYLESTVGYQQELQEEMCNACDECGQDEEEEEAEEEDGEEEDDAEEEDGERRKKRRKLGRKLAVDCDSCADECDKIENMEANGYIDATEFLECQMIYGPDDDAKDALYAGPMCASSGSRINIGVFTDEACSIGDSSKNVDDYLVDEDGYQMKLSHALLKTVYTDTCISCLQVEEEDENEDEDGDEDEDAEEQEAETNELCQALYEEAAKCESSHGFDNGYADYDGYENQVAQEKVVCNFISSVYGGTYDDTGEISIYGANKSVNGGSSTTGGQKFALTFFILGTVGLAVYAAMLHQKLTKGGKAGLSSQGGAMA